MTESSSLARTFDETRYVGHHKFDVATQTDHAEMGLESCERIIRNLWFRRRHSRDEGALARVWKAHERDVGHELQLEL